MKAVHWFGLVLATLVSGWASFSFFKGSLYSHLSVTNAASLTRAAVGVVSPQQTFVGYPPSVYMEFFQACLPDKPCARTDDFRVDPLPKGCCVMLLTNGDAKGNNGVSAYEVFLNGERVLLEGNSRNAQATVAVKTSNSIKLVLTGKPTAKVFVLMAFDPRRSR